MTMKHIKVFLYEICFKKRGKKNMISMYDYDNKNESLITNGEIIYFLV